VTYHTENRFKIENNHLVIM